MTQEQKKFIERVGALAAADMQKSGVLASMTIAQAILESGWGKSGLTVKGNALFGIKAGTSWTGAVYSGKTQECYDGVTFTTVTGLFRAYGSWAESVADHSDLLSCNARYKAVIGERDYKAACRAIAAAGYATDPKYADKLVQIIEAYALTAYDGAGNAAKPGGTTTTPAALAFAVGDVVRFTGNTHYTNAAAASGAACKPGTAKVTALAKGAKHPYHLIKQPGGGSTVYGWVNAADVQAVGSGTTAPKMRVGAKVKYSGPLYRDSNGGGQGKTVNGTYTVKYYYPARKCGVHIDGLGWVPESGCTVIG